MGIDGARGVLVNVSAARETLTLTEWQEAIGVSCSQFAPLAVPEVGALEEAGVQEQEQGLEQGRVVGARGPRQRRPVEVVEPQRAPLEIDVDEGRAR